MAYKFTNTEKWSDLWFSNLKPIEKLLFIYLCENCDIAGFIELNIKRWASDIGTTTPIIQGALKGLQRGLIYSISGDCLYINNFLKHQKNLPLNDKNKAHIGIIKRFDLYSFKFNIEDINEFIQGASKGLPSPTGNGSGNGIDKDIKEPWKNSFDVYLNECKDGYKKYMEDSILMATQKKLNPGINIPLTIEKSFKNYWGTEEGWVNKKGKRTNEINWKSTITRAITNPMNKVYYTKQELASL